MIRQRTNSDQRERIYVDHLRLINQISIERL